MRIRRLVLVAIAVLAAAGCARNPDPDAFVFDPYEETNRDIHAFNKGFDTVLLRPVAQVYDTVTPGLARLLIRNGLGMFDLPAIFVNNVLQGEPLAALRTAGRFSLNVVLGAGGLLDPATEFGLPEEDTDLGVTFARWGLEEGPYVELPFLGPSTSRHAVGRVGDLLLDPLNLVSFGGVGESVDALQALDAAGPVETTLGIVDVRARNAAGIDRALYRAEDSYVTVRSSYLQMRRRRVAGGATAEQIPDVFEE